VSNLTAFSADGYTARWSRWDHDGDETLTLRWENEGWTVTGELTRERASYVVRLSPTWAVRQFLLFRDLDQPDLWLGTDGASRWGEVNGAHRPDLDGCVAVHLDATPFSHTLIIRGTDLDVGDSVDLTVASIDIDTLGVVPQRHRYHRSAERRWSMARADGETTELAIDEFGLPLDVPQRFRRR
jgi:hypothetical protein